MLIERETSSNQEKLWMREWSMKKRKKLNQKTQTIVKFRTQNTSTRKQQTKHTKDTIQQTKYPMIYPKQIFWGQD